MVIIRRKTIHRRGLITDKLEFAHGVLDQCLMVEPQFNCNTQNPNSSKEGLLDEQPVTVSGHP